MSKNLFGRAVNFFRNDEVEVIGAYFDGGKVFVARQNEHFELDVDGSELEQIAEKISLACAQHGWQTSEVGLCLRDDDAVTFQTEITFPDKEIPAFVESWAVAQAGAGASYSFVKVGVDLWMETLTKPRLDEFCAAFEKFGLNLRALSIMPRDLLEKVTPFDRVSFILSVMQEKKSPNLLTARSNAWNLKKISQAIAAITLLGIIGFSANIFIDYRNASTQRDAAKISLDELSDDLILKSNIDADIAELNRLNKISAAQGITPTKFNLLLKLGKVAGNGVRLTKIRAEENFLELEGLANTPDAVQSYLGRVKSSVAQSSRLESSSEREDGDIAFVIRAAF